MLSGVYRRAAVVKLIYTMHQQRINQSPSEPCEERLSLATAEFITVPGLSVAERGPGHWNVGISVSIRPFSVLVLHVSGLKVDNLMSETNELM